MSRSKILVCYRDGGGQLQILYLDLGSSVLVFGFGDLVLNLIKVSFSRDVKNVSLVQRIKQI